MRRRRQRRAAGNESVAVAAAARALAPYEIELNRCGSPDMNLENDRKCAARGPRERRSRRLVVVILHLIRRPSEKRRPSEFLLRGLSSRHRFGFKAVTG